MTVDDYPDPAASEGESEPQARAAERAFLGAVLTSPAVLEGVDGHVTGTDFYEPRHETIWHAILELRQAGTPPDAVTVGHHLMQDAAFTRAGGAPYIHTLVADCPNPTHAATYATQVRDASRARAAANVGRRITSLASTASPAELSLALADGLDELDRVVARVGPSEADRARLTTEAFQRDVDAEARRIQVRDAARRKITDEARESTPPMDAGLLRDVLARPAEPPHRVDGLIPSDGGTLLIAQRKTGKTTLTLNLARTLITGEQFLGRFDVRPIAGTVAILNYEVSGAQIARWANDVGIPDELLLLVNLRGRRNPLAHDTDREQLAALLRHHQVESLIVDPFGRAYTGLNQNDAGEVGAWLADLDRFARGEAGVSDVILTVHAGWQKDRTRGSSALEDWADSILTLTKNEDDTRFLKAIGRDVELQEDSLHYDEITRLLRLTGTGSRRQSIDAQQAEDWLDEVVRHVEKNVGINKGQLEKDFNIRAETVRAAVDLAITKGLIRRVIKGRSQLHYPTNPAAIRPDTIRPDPSQHETPETQGKT